MRSTTNYIGRLTKTVAVMLAIAGFVSCGKDKNDEPAPPPPTAVVEVKGYWTGIYTTSGTLAQDKYGMLIKAGGAARVYSLDVSTDTTMIPALAKVDGTWVLNGTTLEVSYAQAGNQYTTSATVNSVQKTMIGTWAKNGVVKGTISLSK
jgi:hypothetical protein